MRIGVPKETADGERRVALVPDVVRRLKSAGHDVVIEPGAGVPADLPDAEYEAAGAELGDPWGADVIARVPNLPAIVSWLHSVRKPVLLKTDRAKKELGWKPEVDFRELVRMMVESDVRMLAR